MFQHAGIWQAGSHPPQIYGDYKFLGEIIWNMHAGRGRGGTAAHHKQETQHGKIHYSFIHSKFESAYHSFCLFCTDSANIFYQPPSSLPRNRERWKMRKRHWHNSERMSPSAHSPPNILDSPSFYHPPSF